MVIHRNASAISLKCWQVRLSMNSLLVWNLTHWQDYVKLWQIKKLCMELFVNIFWEQLQILQWRNCYNNQQPQQAGTPSKKWAVKALTSALDPLWSRSRSFIGKHDLKIWYKFIHGLGLCKTNKFYLLNKTAWSNSLHSILLIPLHFQQMEWVV